jgi:Zn-dependent protease
VSQRPPQDYDYDPGSFSDYELEQLRPGDELRPYEPIHPRGTNWKKILERIWAPIAALIALTIKFSAFAVKFFGIFISVAAYALIWGWRFAVGFVLLILVHELGHFFEARRQGLHATWPTFIPFFGAFVLIKDAPLNPWRNALVSLAGPALGGVGAAVCWVIAEAANSDLLRALAYAGFLINLINLVPIGILDGGSVWRSIQLARHSVAAPPGQQFAMGSTYPIAIPGGGPSRAWQIGFLYGTLATLLVLGMIATHVTQHRL